MPSRATRVRPGAEPDAGDVSRVHAAAIRGTAAAFYPPEVIEAWAGAPSEARIEGFRRAIAGGEESFVVADDGGEVVGFGSIALGAAEVRAVYVHPRAGRRNVGGSILRALEDLALSAGIAEISLEASLNAEAFYRQHGFEVVDRREHGLGAGMPMACVKMRKVLRPAGG